MFILSPSSVAQLGVFEQWMSVYRGTGYIGLLP